MAQTYRPVQLPAGIVERLNGFKERLGNQVFMNPTALGLGACIGVLLDIEAFCTERQYTPSHADVKMMAAAYPQRGRKRVSQPARDDSMGHELESGGSDSRICRECGIRFANSEEIFARCQGSVKL